MIFRFEPGTRVGMFPAKSFIGGFMGVLKTILFSTANLASMRLPSFCFHRVTFRMGQVLSVRSM